MAQATGYCCDVCKEFVSTNGTGRPEGWMNLGIVAGERSQGFDICSNACLLKLAKMRDQADKEEKRAKKQQKIVAYEPESNGNGNEVTPTESGRSLWMGHLSRHRQKSIVDPDCSYCDRETQPQEVSN